MVVNYENHAKPSSTYINHSDLTHFAYLFDLFTVYFTLLSLAQII
jgi:hypothetical protein